LLVHAGDHVEAGDPLIEGPMVPHDILRIKGEEALQQYLISEVQAVYRSQNVTINDKHIEVIVGQMLRKVKVESPGDSSFLPGEVVDKFKFRDENERLAKSIKIAEPGDSSLKVADIVTRSELSEANEKVEAEGGEPARGKKPKQASASTVLLGITKASLQSESFISAASFQETTKVLTEAAISSAVDTLRGLKENVILGHLIPAGTAFKPHLEIGVRLIGEPLPAPEAVPGEVALAGGASPLLMDAPQEEGGTAVQTLTATQTRMASEFTFQTQPGAAGSNVLSSEMDDVDSDDGDHD
jgi:DNA-directed RNA polymerase subunit beta'